MSLQGGAAGAQLDLVDLYGVFQSQETSDVVNFNEGTPLGLEEWLIDTGCMLALGDGAGLNFATLESGLAEKLRRRFVGPRKPQR